MLIHCVTLGKHFRCRSLCSFICNNGPVVLPLRGLNEIIQVTVPAQVQALHIVDAQ